MEPEPQPGDEPPAAPRAESPLAVFSDDSSTDDGEDLPAEDQSSKELWCCHCSTSPASSQTEHIVKILVRERGWRQWPTEEHVYPGSTSKVVRPKDCTKVAFCNSGFWSLCFEISIDQTELLYDRVNLAKLTSSRDCTTSNICPPSYVIRAGEPPPQIQPSTGPSVWFLKKNLSNFGLGVVAVKTPEEAFELVEPDGVYVLQPHIHRPVLFDGRKFHLRLYLMVAQRRTWTRDQRPGGARFYAHRGATKMPVSSKSWSEASVDKVAQVTTSRGNIRFADWEHCDAAWSAMVETTLLLCKRLTPHLKVPKSAKTKFEMLGADYMLEDTGAGLKAWLLEVNTGPVMAEEDEGLCGGMIATVMDPVNNPAGDPLGGWEGLLPDRSS